jgi:hypothetical protein
VTDLFILAHSVWQQASRLEKERRAEQAREANDD